MIGIISTDGNFPAGARGPGERTTGILVDEEGRIIVSPLGGPAGPGGGAAQVFSGNYGGGVPTDTPTTTAALAYDLDDPFTLWHWDGAAWT